METTPIQTLFLFALIILPVSSFLKSFLRPRLRTCERRYESLRRSIECDSTHSWRSGILYSSFIDENEVKFYDDEIIRKNIFNVVDVQASNVHLLYADDDILVFDKPAEVQSAPGFRSNVSLASDVQKIFNLPRIDHMIVHRLDYATSGVIMYARNHDALKQLHAQFRRKNTYIYKRYSAIVSGILNSPEGLIDLPLGKDYVNPPMCRVDTMDGKASLTSYQVDEWCAVKNATKVSLYPITGRTHQLRIHMQAIGHPIVGDLFYGE